MKDIKGVDVKVLYDVIIAGAGVIGSALARELSRYQLSVCVLEKENDVAMGATKANSGIIHGGFDPEPGTLKAKMNVEGVPLIYKAAKELNVPFRQCGSIVCAFNEQEANTVKDLYDRGVINGVEGMKLLNKEEVLAIEPALSVNICLALLIPSAGIICPYKLAIAAMGNAMDNGATLIRNFNIDKVIRNDGAFEITSVDGKTVEGKFFINCAGAHSDVIAEKAGDKFFTIIPRNGEYLLLDKTEGATVHHTIFQVPGAEGKGILVSPTVDGNLLTGPTAEVSCSPDANIITQAGISKVVNQARKSVPGVNFRQTITSFAGIRASEKNSDFIIKASDSVAGLIHVAAIDSPGLTSCFAIAQYVINILKDNNLTLTEKEYWNPVRENTDAFREMSYEQKDEYIKEHPEYGKIVCRCEGVSEGEILDAIKRNPRALDVDSVKRRTRAGMGRCQAGFCMPYVMELIARENNVALEEVTKKGNGSYIVTGRI